MRVNVGIVVMVFVTSAALVLAAGAAATRGVQLRFTTVVHDSTQQEPALRGQIGLVRFRVVPNATSVDYAGLSKAQKAAVDAIDLNRFFLVEIGIAEPTTGFNVTIKRVAAQRISRTHRQFCVVARIGRPQPGHGVNYGQPIFAVHIAKLSSKRFGLFGNDLPTAAVLRSTQGKLLGKIVYTLHSAPADLFPPRPSLCRAS